MLPNYNYICCCHPEMCLLLIVLQDSWFSKTYFIVDLVKILREQVSKKFHCYNCMLLPQDGHAELEVLFTSCIGEH